MGKYYLSYESESLNQEYFFYKDLRIQIIENADQVLTLNVHTEDEVKIIREIRKYVEKEVHKAFKKTIKQEGIEKDEDETNNSLREYIKERVKQKREE